MTAEEERAAVERHGDEEALFRAALALELHLTDPIVRRRLIQRMRFLEEDTAQLREPTDGELRDFVQGHPGSLPPVRELSFDHRFFARSMHGGGLERDAREARAQLLAGASVEGDPFPRRINTERARWPGLARQLGPDVAEAFFAAPEGSWSEPVSSAYGLHLVRVTQRSRRAHTLAEVGPRARALWLAERRTALGRSVTASLRAGPEAGR